MLVLNFSHPLNETHLTQIAELSGHEVQQVFDIPVQFDQNTPFEDQINAVLANLPLNGVELQSEALLINPPALNFITALLLAELHGRMGYFPAVIRIRPMEDSLPRYEVAEILNLQVVRDRARRRRYGPG